MQKIIGIISIYSYNETDYTVIQYQYYMYMVDYTNINLLYSKCVTNGRAAFMPRSAVDCYIREL